MLSEKTYEIAVGLSSIDPLAILSRKSVTSLIGTQVKPRGSSALSHILSSSG